MSMPLPAVTQSLPGYGLLSTPDFSHLQVQREQLTLRLRNLASDLDALDRRLSDLMWRHRNESIGLPVSENTGERGELEARRAQLTTRLRAMAKELTDLDAMLAGRSAHLPGTGARVGTCPECGYPSLDSSLCAFCPPRLAL